METLSDPAGVVAVTAGALALLALGLGLVLALRLRRLRAEQRRVLGDRETDLVAHSAALQDAFAVLHDRVEEVAQRLEERVQATETRLDGAVAHRALVRYDAYGDLFGHQSMSLALLDAHHSGVVLSCIAHRENARLYCKQLHAGVPDQELSPEETEAVRRAVSGETEAVVLERVRRPVHRARSRAG